jgi:hypothetical protein
MRGKRTPTKRVQRPGLPFGCRPAQTAILLSFEVAAIHIHPASAASERCPNTASRRRWYLHAEPSAMSTLAFLANARSVRRPERVSSILLRTLHPQERLNVDHVAWR